MQSKIGYLVKWLTEQNGDRSRRLQIGQKVHRSKSRQVTMPEGVPKQGNQSKGVAHSCHAHKILLQHAVIYVIVCCDCAHRGIKYSYIHGCPWLNFFLLNVYF